MTLELVPNPILKTDRVDDASATFRVPTSPSSRDAKLRRRALAAESIGELSIGLEMYIVSKGQFSLVDVIRAVVEQTGPADLSISTWTAAGADIAEAFELLESGRIRSARFLLDHSFQRRQPAFCGQVRNLFGDDAIRITKNHAKLVVLTNDDWNVNVLTSMNLNQNPRLEFLLVRESAELAEFNLGWIDEIFERNKPSEGFGTSKAESTRMFLGQ